MNTSNPHTIPLLKPEDELIYLMEFIEPAMSVNQMDRVIDMWNQGLGIETIAQREKRHFLEILCCLLHQVYVPNGFDKANKQVEKPYSNLSSLLVPGKVQLERRKLS